MSLATMTSNLTTLKFGRDRPNGGSSNEPYIVKQPTKHGNTGGLDFLVRGGLLFPTKRADDVSRITQMFGDFKSPRGILFTAKQNLLSRVSILDSKSHFQQKIGLGLNDGVYLPTSTIASTALLGTGTKLNKQGIDPSRKTDQGINSGSLFGLLDNNNPLRLPIYYDKAILTDSKLSPLYNFTQMLKTSDGKSFELYNYQGGPGSILGIGKTRVSTYDFTGFDNKKYLEKIGYNTWSDNWNKDDLLNISEKLNKYIPIEPLIFHTRFKKTDTEKSISKYEEFSNNIKPSQDDINHYQNVIIDSEYRSRNKDLINSPETITPNIPSFNSLSHLTQNRNRKSTTPLDKINVSSIYEDSIGRDKNRDDQFYEDLIKFRIGIIKNDNPSNKEYIHFRAYIDSFNDNWSSEWSEQNYSGRGEKYYRYNGFTRGIDLSFKIVAHSYAELIPLYKKLNHLLSSMTPDYSSFGYMRGNLVELTLGDYIYNQVGIIKNINIGVPQDSPWDIDENRQLPHYLNITGVSFIPIHNFIPRKQTISEYENNERNFIYRNETTLNG